jgi:hypothetical protein
VKRVFVDTSALVALFNKNDTHHLRAKTVLEKIREDRTRMLITDYIFDECVTTVLSAAGHQSAVTIGDFLLGSRIIEIVWLDNGMKLRAWEYFRRHSDKLFSFTDCTSFIVMKELRVNRFFSFDSDFRQAGFVEYS